MPRIRTLKPEHKAHRKIGPLTDFQYRAWVALITEADDEGRVVADAAWLRVTAWGYHPNVTVAEVEHAVLELAKVGLIRLYTTSRVRYAAFPSWRDHQRINRPTPSRLPAPPAPNRRPLTEDSVSGHGALTTDSRRKSLSGHGGSEGSGSEGSGSEGSGSEGSLAVATKTTIGKPQPVGALLDIPAGTPFEKRVRMLREAEGHHVTNGAPKP